MEYKTLGEIGTFIYGYTGKASKNGTTRYIRITDIGVNGLLLKDNAVFIDQNAENEKYLTSFGDLLVARTGATYGKTLFVDNYDPAIYASFLIKISFKEPIIYNRFYWHYSQSSHYWKQANKLVSIGGLPQFNANVIKQISVPVPPLPVQEEIVRILDRFDALVNDISVGLPAELSARRQQYEYYRNRLLTFERAR